MISKTRSPRSRGEEGPSGNAELSLLRRRGFGRLVCLPISAPRHGGADSLRVEQEVVGSRVALLVLACLSSRLRRVTSSPAELERPHDRFLNLAALSFPVCAFLSTNEGSIKSPLLKWSGRTTRSLPGP